MQQIKSTGLQKPNLSPRDGSDTIVDLKNENMILFPAYPEGKFYKNGEDVILKNKIKKLEEKQDP